MSKPDIHSEQSWQFASRYADLLFPIPPRLVFAIRALRRNFNENLEIGSNGILPSSFAAVRMVDRLRALKVPVYFAASQLFPDRFQTAEDDTTKAMLRVLGLDVMSSLLLLVWFYRRIGKLCAAEVCELLQADYLRAMEIGFHVADIHPALPHGDGLLLGGLRYSALGALMIRDADAYSRYRNAKRGRMDIEFEHERWGCDHSQIGVYLMRRLGFGLQERSDESPISPIVLREILLGLPVQRHGVSARIQGWSACNDILNQMKLALLNVDVLKAVSKNPERVSQFVQLVQELEQRGSSFLWMKKGFAAEDAELPKPEGRKEQTRPAVPGFTQEELQGLSREEIEELRQYSEHYEKDRG